MRNRLNHTQDGVMSTKLTSAGEGHEDIELSPTPNYTVRPALALHLSKGQTVKQAHKDRSQNVDR